MRVEVTPAKVTLLAHTPIVLTLTITNTRDIISGYAVRALGVDPEQVTVEGEKLALFPGGSRIITVTLTLSPDLPAGHRIITLQVLERTEPQAIELVEVDVEVPALPQLQLRLSPATVTAGKRAPFGLIAENLGNSRVDLPLRGIDEENKVRFRFSPAFVSLEPGERAALDVELAAKRRFAGAMVVRTFAVTAADYDAVAAGDEPLAKTVGSFVQKPVLSRGGLSLAGLVLAATVFALVLTYALTKVSTRSAADRDLAVQVALAGSGSSAAAGSSGLSGKVEQLTSGDGVGGVTVDVFSSADTANPITSEATNDSGGFSLAGLPAGGYKLRFRGAGFAEIWYPQSLTDADATEVMLQPGAVKSGLDVRLGGLPGSLSGMVTGPNGVGAVVTLQVAGVGPVVVTDITLPGADPQTGQIAPPAVQPTGAVAGAPTSSVPTPDIAPAPATTTAAVVPQPAAPTTADPNATGAVTGDVAPPLAGSRLFAPAAVRPASLVRPAADASSPAPAPSSTAIVPGGNGTGTANGGASQLSAGAVFATVTAGAGGAFAFANVPSPGTYDIVVRQTGYAIATQRIDLAGGETRQDVLVPLKQGDGLIRGIVSDASGPLALATVTASDGITSTVQTVSAADGTFTLRGLTTPASYTVTVSKDDHAPATIQLGLSQRQQYNGVTVSLPKQTGVLQGIAKLVPPGPAPSAGAAAAEPKAATGVSVTVSNGATTVKTVTASTSSGHLVAGGWSISGLPVSTTYTVTFTRADLASQTESVSLDAQGHSSGGLVNIDLAPATGTVTGTVLDVVTAADKGRPLGGVPVTLTSSAQVYTVTSVSVPGTALGTYVIDNVIPGTYTLTATANGTTGLSQVLNVSGGLQPAADIKLTSPASLSGVVIGSDGGPLEHALVRLFAAASYPNNPIATAFTGPDGGYVFPSIDAPANYEIDVEYPAGTTPSDSRTLTVIPTADPKSRTPVVNLTAVTNGSGGSTPTPSNAASPSASAAPALVTRSRRGGP